MSSITQLHSMTERILANRGTDKKMRASVEAAISPSSEHRAYPWVLPYVDSPLNQPAFLRAAAITARHVDVPHQAGISLGRSLRKLSTAISGATTIDPGKPDSIATRLTILIALDLDQAADLINQLIGQAAKHRVAVDYRELASTLLLWGDGIDDKSVTHRQKLLAGYYYTHLAG